MIEDERLLDLWKKVPRELLLGRVPDGLQADRAVQDLREAHKEENWHLQGVYGKKKKEGGKKTVPEARADSGHCNVFCHNPYRSWQFDTSKEPKNGFNAVFPK